MIQITCSKTESFFQLFHIELYIPKQKTPICQIIPFLSLVELKNNNKKTTIQFVSIQSTLPYSSIHYIIKSFIVEQTIQDCHIYRMLIDETIKSPSQCDQLSPFTRHSQSTSQVQDIMHTNAVYFPSGMQMLFILR